MFDAATFHSKAAVNCVSWWHYRPAIKDDQLVDAPMTVKVDWSLADRDDAKKPDAPKPDPAPEGG
jgi:hypothetical protein